LRIRQFAEVFVDLERLMNQKSHLITLTPQVSSTVILTPSVLSRAIPPLAIRTLHCLWAFLFDLPKSGTCRAAFLQSAMFLAELESVSASDSHWAVGKDSGSADLSGGVG
jgi:hypothetical protein